MRVAENGIFNRSTTVLEAPRVGCAMDGMATDFHRRARRRATNF